MPAATNRRDFLKHTALLGAGLYAGGFSLARGASSPNEKLNLGVIGVGNRGGNNLDAVVAENIVALCDVDDRMMGEAVAKVPQAARYRDFRKMLDEQKLDAVVVSTPDHNHAFCAVTAMRRGLHCYCEKPLARTVSEARLITQTAKEYHVVSQMGTQIHATQNYRRVVEVIQSGAIGPVHTVYVWINKDWGGAIWPTGTQPVPAELDWDLWLGPAAYRPYNEAYLPKEWRRFWDFGGGTLSDMGCHYLDLVFWSLGLKYPTTCAAEGRRAHPVTTPNGLKVTWEFPARGEQPPVKVVWSDGLAAQTSYDGHDFGGAGVYFVGSEGALHATYGNYQLFPEEKYADFKPPEPTIPDSIGHHAEWIRACKTGAAPSCRFDYSGPLAEAVVLGTVAHRIGRKIEWDAVNLRATNAPEAADVIWQPSRQGWEL